MKDGNLIVTGFMGTGKTTVGRRVAERLGRPFVDMDAEIERRAGCSVAEIFARDGEATFRALEAALCRELAARRGLVIATGGGALVETANREALAATGWIVCLDVAPAAVLARLATEDGKRPLLSGPDPERAIAALLETRADAYRAISHHVDTTDLTSDQVVEEVIRLWQSEH